ncbi:MAG: hypothetical protein ACE5HU_04150 [Acidobacteriota bacterium]
MAAVLSIGLPGLGHLYLKRFLLGACEMLGGLALFAAALVQLGRAYFEVLGGSLPPLDLLRVSLAWAPALVLYSLLDGAFTWLVSRRRSVLKDPS